MENLLKISKIVFFTVWSLVGLCILFFIVVIIISNPMRKMEQGLKQLERVNQSNTSPNLQEKDKQIDVSHYLSSVLSEKMKVCFVSVLGEKRFSEVDRDPGSLTNDDQQKLTACISQESFSRQPLGVTGFTSVIVSPFPTQN